MNGGTRKRRIDACARVYLLLLLLTAVTWGLGRAGYQGLPVALAVLFTALVKGQLIGDWFMELRGRAGIWRWIIVLWLTIPGALIATAFWLSYRS